MVTEPSVFEPLKFYCTNFNLLYLHLIKKKYSTLTLLHSEQPKLHGVLAVLSALGLNDIQTYFTITQYFILQVHILHSYKLQCVK